MLQRFPTPGTRRISGPGLRLQLSQVSRWGNKTGQLLRFVKFPTTKKPEKTRGLSSCLKKHGIFLLVLQFFFCWPALDTRKKTTGFQSDRFRMYDSACGKSIFPIDSYVLSLMQGFTMHVAFFNVCCNCSKIGKWMGWTLGYPEATKTFMVVSTLFYFHLSFGEDVSTCWRSFFNWVGSSTWIYLSSKQ